MNSDYERVKFIFPSLDKYIIMDFNRKITLEDLKFTFTNVLKIDLFSKRPQFSISKGFNLIQLNSQKNLSEQNIQNFLQKDKNHIEITVKFLEEGA
ncbi:unnamed protein product [Paramecium octaurelia]|uniref:Uncharacterized protein n=1 Tax=Paramecium octaurelia TaxID=43137 RepID=A0A8S1T493_PAROT|nr:unnamed protein product [Paramecium octaurelia]